MSKSKEPVYSNLELLLALTDPAYKPKIPTTRELELSEELRRNEEELRRNEELLTKIYHLLRIRRRYTGEWNAGAEYLYSELMRAYGLDDGWREDLIELARLKHGRKHDVGKAVRITLLRQSGMTASQIAEQLGREGHAISIRGVESYLKRRRKRPIEEEVLLTLIDANEDV
ncbi:MAG: hypothetical protein ACYCSP_08395 [Acidobacteriaceae bacterium]